jgi:hypothetical protein
MRALLSGLAASLAFLGCGVPTNGGPRTVASDDLPADLRLSGGPASTTTIPGPLAAVIVYWIRGNELVAAPATATAPVTVTSVLGLLQSGPDARLARQGDRSALKAGNLIRTVYVSGRTASIDLDPSFANSLPSDQVLALGQCVLTVARLAQISHVRFTVAGRTTQLPRADGSLTADPVTPRDYQPLVAR